MNVLHSARELARYTLRAVDGDLGSVDSFYLDETSWRLRYIMANASNRLQRRRILISPMVIGDITTADKTISIQLTLDQIEHSPDMTLDQTISREYEVAYHQYYQCPPYWQSVQIPNAPTTKNHESVTVSEHMATGLRRTAELRGCALAATDCVIGHVTDFIIDTQYWAIRYLKNDARSGRFNKQILINPDWLKEVNWGKQILTIDLSAEEIKSAPELDSSHPINRDYEIKLFNHYGRCGYWCQKTSGQPVVERLPAICY